MDAGTMYANAKALHELLQEARAENAKLVMKLNAEHLVRQNVERENAKLRQAFNETLARLIAANYSTEVNYMDDDYCDLLRELGIEVGE